MPHSGRQLFEGIKPFGAEDPMLWTQKEGDRTIIKAILHDEQGPSRETAIGRCPGPAPLSWPLVWALPLTRGRHLDSRKKAKLPSGAQQSAMVVVVEPLAPRVGVPSQGASRSRMTAGARGPMRSRTPTMALSRGQMAAAPSCFEESAPTWWWTGKARRLPSRMACRSVVTVERARR